MDRNAPSPSLLTALGRVGSLTARPQRRAEEKERTRKPKEKRRPRTARERRQESMPLWVSSIAHPSLRRSAELNVAAAQRLTGGASILTDRAAAQRLPDGAPSRFPSGIRSTHTRITATALRGNRTRFHARSFCCFDYSIRFRPCQPAKGRFAES